LSDTFTKRGFIPPGENEATPGGVIALEVTPLGAAPLEWVIPADHPAIGIWQDRADLPTDSCGRRMNKGIIDSSILIDCLRGHRNAVSSLASQEQPSATPNWLPLMSGE
jgi:hypothetical protein